MDPWLPAFKKNKNNKFCHTVCSAHERLAKALKGGKQVENYNTASSRTTRNHHINSFGEARTSATNHRFHSDNFTDFNQHMGWNGAWISPHSWRRDGTIRLSAVCTTEVILTGRLLLVLKLALTLLQTREGLLLIRQFWGKGAGLTCSSGGPPSSLISSR